MRCIYFWIVLAGLLVMFAACPAAGQINGNDHKTTDVRDSRSDTLPRGAEQEWLWTEDRHNVCAWYWAPQKPDAPGVILLHMRGSDKSAWVSMAQSLVDEGFAAIAIDLRGHGQTVGSDGKEIPLKSLKNEDYTDMLKDVRAAHDFLDSRKDVDGDRVAIIGASIGANLGIIYAAGDRRVRTVVAMSPGLDYFGLKPLDYLDDYGARALYVLAAKKDKYAFESSVSIGQSADKADPFSLRAFEGKTHGTDLLKEHPGLDMTIISGWLLNHLPPVR